MNTSAKTILAITALVLLVSIASATYYFAHISVEANSPEQVFLDGDDRFVLNLPPGDSVQKEVWIINNHPSREYTVSLQWNQTRNEGDVNYWTSSAQLRNITVAPGRTKVLVQWYVYEDSPPGYFDGQLLLGRVQASD